MARSISNKSVSVKGKAVKDSKVIDIVYSLATANSTNLDASEKQKKYAQTLLAALGDKDVITVSFQVTETLTKADIARKLVKRTKAGEVKEADLLASLGLTKEEE